MWGLKETNWCKKHFESRNEFFGLKMVHGKTFGKNKGGKKYMSQKFWSCRTKT